MNFDSHSTFFHANLKLLLQKEFKAILFFKILPQSLKFSHSFFFTIQNPQKNSKSKFDSFAF